MRITDKIEIPESELHEIYSKGSGPGGQNVNKVSTAVQLRYDSEASKALPPRVKDRLIKHNYNRINNSGEFIVEAHHFRTQAQNRMEARRKLERLIRNALRQPRKRLKTKPTLRSTQNRLDRKKKHGQKKSLRRKPGFD